MHKATQTSFQQIKVAPSHPDTSPLLLNLALVTQPRGAPLDPPGPQKQHRREAPRPRSTWTSPTLVLPPHFFPLLQRCLSRAVESRMTAPAPAPSDLLQDPSPRLASGLLAYPRAVCSPTPGPPQKEGIEEFFKCSQRPSRCRPQRTWGGRGKATKDRHQEAQLIVISKTQLLIARDHRRILEPSDILKVEITRRLLKKGYQVLFMSKDKPAGPGSRPDVVAYSGTAGGTWSPSTSSRPSTPGQWWPRPGT